ncbi:secretin [Afipia sp. P52-10]|jgi:pilus assembly protein CpaC|uniref:type II and III secretion system protein family protein n=1 Tax=Afipia sp. P52-10 TaxID=1429916 RepID=UPI0003DF36EF|nr:type II and III secretion system protein family protein [Afipia sp. P52-10]ETR77375.1 secretin [Afipia sp. P52-10]
MTRRLTLRSQLAQAVCALSFMAMAVVALTPANSPAIASDYRAGSPAPIQGATRFLPLGIGKSVVIDLPREIKDVLVADPKIANAVVRSAQRAYIIGAAVGQTNIFFFDSEGQQIAAYDIAVTRDLNGVRAALKQAMPNADISIEGVGDGVVLSGVVNSPVDAQQAADLAGRLVGDPAKVVNGIVVRGRDQVMLKVTVAEVQRDVIKQLGIDLSGSLNIGTSVVNFNNANPFSVNGKALVDSNAITGQFKSVNATVRAMERAGVVRTLAEPNLTAISGEAAAFVAGGEFPIPKGYTCDPVTRSCSTQVDFKKFGITLNFTPVVLTEGRISLRVMTEVSELSSDNSLQLAQAVSQTTTNTLTIPSIRTRRADTTVEIPSGGSLAMAGLIQEQTRVALNGLPGLMQLPVLGTLFKSRDYVNRQTELMVLVTPYVVRAVAQKDLSRPDDGFVDSSDPSSVMTGAINRIYGVPAHVDPVRQRRNVFGFITD